MKTYRIGDLIGSSTRELICEQTGKVVGIAHTTCGPAYCGKGMVIVSRKSAGAMEDVRIKPSEGSEFLGQVYCGE